MIRSAATPARGRPKCEEKRDRIVHAAIDLFLKHGTEGVSMDEIAAAAGVSKQTLYSHFGSKDALFSQCLEQRCRAHELNHELLDTQAPVARSLRRFARRYLQVLLSPETIRLKRLLAAPSDSTARLAEIYHRAGPARIIDELAHYLDIQQERGELQTDDARRSAVQLLYMLQGEAHARALLGLSVPKETELERYANSCVELFLEALRC